MQVLNIDSGKVTTLFGYARQVGAPYLPALFDHMVRRYQFSKYPQQYEDKMADAVAFLHGNYNGYAFDLTMYNDGLVISSRSRTDIIDDILVDVKKIAREHFNIETFKTADPDTMYESSFVFQTEKELLKLMAPFSDICSAVSKALTKANGSKAQFLPYGFSLAPDVGKIIGMRPPPFRIERRGGTAHSFNHYYTAAPLKTADHISIIEMLERSV